jgi:hypothetical protein
MTNLQDLVQAHPDLWQNIFAKIKDAVGKKDIQSLAALRVSAQNELKKYSKHDVKFVTARMTILALDQFADAFVGKGQTRAGWRDRFMFHFMLSKALKKQTLSCKDFDTRWNRLSDKIWAAGEIQRLGIWSVPTLELAQGIAHYTQGRPTLEVGAGHGLLSKALRGIGIVLRAVDIDAQTSDVECLDAKIGLSKYQPTVVISSWPPPANNFEIDIFKTSSVELYLAITSKHQFASGNWEIYKNQKGFTCTSSEKLNAFLRPHEFEQQVLVFRRK